MFNAHTAARHRRPDLMEQEMSTSKLLIIIGDQGSGKTQHARKQRVSFSVIRTNSAAATPA